MCTLLYIMLIITTLQDLNQKICHKSGQPCTGHCKPQSGVDQLSQSVHIVSDSSQWLRPTTLNDLCKLLAQHKNDNYRLVFGNTAFGGY